MVDCIIMDIYPYSFPCGRIHLYPSDSRVSYVIASANGTGQM